MTETADKIHLLLDILALLAVAYAIVKGIFKAGSDDKAQKLQVDALKVQIDLHSKWIEDHQECNQKQISILNELREDIAYLRGRFKASESKGQ